MRAVNLLPRDDGRSDARKDTALPALVAVAMVIVLSAILATMFLSASAKVADARDTLQGLNDSLAALPPLPAAPEPNGSGLVNEKNQRVAALSAALSRRVAWDRVLREFSLVLPNDVWLSGLTATSPTPGLTADPAVPPAPGAAPKGLVISGYTYSQASVARFLARLQIVPDLTNVQLAKSEIDQIRNHPVVRFSILADVRASGATS